MMTAENAGCTGILIETKPPAESALALHPPMHRFKNHSELAGFLEKYLGAKAKTACDTPPSVP